MMNKNLFPINLLPVNRNLSLFIKMNGQKELYTVLEQLQIPYVYNEHPAAPTAELAMEYCKNDGATHCKNLFFRNHKGNKHYLVIIEASKNLGIRDLEQKLKQGKLSFASEARMEKFLGLKPGSVSLFGLINDKSHEVIVFLDKNLKSVSKVSFHPNENTASLVISSSDMVKFLDSFGNEYEFLELYENID